MKKHFFFFLMLMLAALALHAQEKLSLVDAINLAMKNNYSMVISKNEATMAANDNTIGNAGMLPSVDLNASANQSINHTKQNYSSGLEVDRSNVQSTNMAVGAGLEWTIFNGFKMFATKSKLNELQGRGELVSKVQIENTLAGIIASYFDIVRLKDLLKAGQSSLDIYNERVRIAETKFRIGSSSKLELLQAKVDLNAQRSLLMNEKTALQTAKINLNQLLGRTVDTEFEPSDSIVIAYQPKVENLRKSFVTQNSTLLAAQKDVNIASYLMKEFESQRYPNISVGANYNYARVKNQVGFILLNQNQGLNYGLNVSWNLFNGMNTNRQVKNAKLEYQNSTLRLNDIRSQTEAAVLQGFRKFEDALELMKLEEENILLARENVTVGLERFRIGKSTQVELQEAMRSLEDAENRTTSARYDAKIAETELMQLNGELVK